MNIYYIDYENVNSFGLKGIQLLGPDSQVNVLYSRKADNVKIDALSEMMKSKAEIHFLPVHVGTPNALDFQLVTLLFLGYRKGNNYYIISKDSGYDCCIKTALEHDAPNIRRFRDIETAVRWAEGGRQAAADDEAQEAVQEDAALSLSGTAVSVPEDTAAVPAPASREETSAAEENASVPVSGPVPAAELSAGEETAPAAEEKPSEETASASTPAAAETASAAETDSASRAEDAAPVSVSDDASADSYVSTPVTSGDMISAGMPAPAVNPAIFAVFSEEAPVKNETASAPHHSRRRRKSQKTSDVQQKAAERPQKTSDDQQRTSAKTAKSAYAQAEPAEKAQKSPDNQQKAADKPQQKAADKPQQKAADKPQQKADAVSDFSRFPPDKVADVISRRCSIVPDPKQLSTIREALLKARNKQQFYSYIVRKCGQKDGLALYHTIRCAYNDLLALETK